MSQTFGTGKPSSVRGLDYGLDDRGIGLRIPLGLKIFLFFLTARPTQGPTQPPIQRFWGYFFGGRVAGGVKLSLAHMPSWRGAR